MNLAQSEGVTRTVSPHVSLNLNGIIANLGPLVENFLLGHRRDLTAFRSAFWT